MDIKIGVVTGCSQLTDLAKEVASELNVEMVLIPGILEDALPLVKEQLNRGLDVIVTRGGTFDILKEKINIPILSVPITAFDLLRGLRQAKKYGNRIGFATYGSPFQHLEEFEKLLGIEVIQILYTKKQEVREGIEKLLKNGIEVIVGWNITFDIALQYGMKPVLLTTDKNSLLKIFKEAINIALIHRKEKEKSKLLQTILDVEQEGVIGIDHKQIVTVFNQAAQELLNIKIEEIIGKPISDFMKSTPLLHVLKNGIPQINKFDNLNGTPVVINASPICLDKTVIGVVATFNEASKISTAEVEIRKKKTKHFLAKYYIDDLIGESKVIRDLKIKIKKFAHSNSTILITGETGTGKEILSHSIHRCSKRVLKPFVGINCSAIQDSLLESELFGYEEGSFTGAKKGGKTGLFELAHEGTMLLDEIGTISESIQSRLLRVIQEKEILRVGGNKVIPVNVRIIATTNRDLLEEIKKGRFREDLYFRLNVLSIKMPSLRERPEDIPPLSEHLIKKHCNKNGKKEFRFSGEMMEKIISYPWPGNVRELENFIERCVLLKDDFLDGEWVFKKLFKETAEEMNYFQNQTGSDHIEIKEDKESVMPLKKIIKSYENDLLKRALTSNKTDSKEEVARKLGISRATLWRKVNSRKTKTNLFQN